MDEEQRNDTNILRDIVSYTMVLFCECWKLGNNEKKVKSGLLWNGNDNDSMQLISSCDPTMALSYKRTIVVPKYRILRQNQCRLLWLLSRVTDNQVSSTTNNIDEDDYRSRSIDRLGWYDIWDRCEQYKNELFVVDSYTGRTPLHIALVKLSSSNNNNSTTSSTIQESVIAEHAMWEQVIESMIELNPHSLIIIDKHNYTPIHLLCNISKIVQSSNPSSFKTNGIQQESSLFHLFEMIIKCILNIPKLYNLPTTELSIISIAKKPTSQSIQPPSPLLLLCRKNSSIDVLYWTLQTKKITTLSWIAPWTGGEIIQDIVTLRKQSSDATNTKDKHHQYPIQQQQFLYTDHLHWNLLRTHETPLETLLLIPDKNNMYGKRIFSMIKIVQECNEERTLWKDIACKLYNLLKQNNVNNKEFYNNDNDKIYYDSIRNVIDEFITSKYPMKSGTLSEKKSSLTTTTTTNVEIALDDNLEECIQEFVSHIQNNRTLWVKSIMLLQSATTTTTTTYNNNDDNETHYNDDDITLFGDKKSIEALVYTVSCLYRPIPELLQLVAIIFPEQLYRKSLDYNHKQNNNNNSSAVQVPLNQVLVLLPIYESEDKRQEVSSFATTSSIIRKKKNSIKSTSIVQNEFIQGIDNIPRKLSRERNNLYMHTRFDFTSPISSSRSDDDDELCDIEEGIMNNISYLNNNFFANSVSKILETQIRVLVEAQPESLIMPITVSIVEQNIYLKYYFYNSNHNDEKRIHNNNNNNNTTTKRLPFWIRDLVFQEQQSQQDNDEEEVNQLLELAYYPFFVASVHNCSLDTIYRMIRYAPEALQLQQF